MSANKQISNNSESLKKAATISTGKMVAPYFLIALIISVWLLLTHIVISVVLHTNHLGTIFLQNYGMGIFLLLSIATILLAVVNVIGLRLTWVFSLPLAILLGYLLFKATLYEGNIGDPPPPVFLCMLSFIFYVFILAAVLAIIDLVVTLYIKYKRRHG